MLGRKKIVLGVSGSIAAYKSALITRLLIKNGAEVRIIMTTSAHDFITPLTLSTLSKNPVLTHFSKNETGEWNNHVELGMWADAMLIAPASANTISKMANGICDNLLQAVYLSARCPVFLAPAMDLDMLKHPATQLNISKLTERGNHLIETNFGELASGLIGNGRMAEPEDILLHLSRFFSEPVLQGKRVLITAGPTHEAIDPVRFIGNNSSGKMGFAIAEALAVQGALVQLVTGPTVLSAKHSNIKVTKVISAEEMYRACLEIFPSTDISVFSAAVADYRPVSKAEQKIKKAESNFSLELTRTPDIAAELGRLKKENQITVGFALETENEVFNAEKKIISKNLDMVVLNSLNDKGAGFAGDTNKISIIDRKGIEKKFTLKSKQEAAEDIVREIIQYVNA